LFYAKPYNTLTLVFIAEVLPLILFLVSKAKNN